jgi:hypothetical protein
MPELLKLDVADIKAGDIYGPTGRTIWTATEDAVRRGAIVTVRIAYADGGLALREFDAGHELEIKR